MKKISRDRILIEKKDRKIRSVFEKDKYEIKDIIINSGNAFGVDVDICFWIVEKK